MTRSLLTFAEVLAENRTAATVGGKALHLAEMAASAAASTNFSFHVPTGVVLTTTAYVSHITNAGVDQAAILDGSLPLADVRAALESTAPDASLVAALDAFLDTCAWGGAWAVRSSGTVEDGAAKSFAGQFETVLNVRGKVALWNAIRLCWASQWSDHVQPYLADMIDRASPPRMAVVIQQQVEPTVAGVLFTLDPQTGNDELFAIEGVWGLGEGLVSGRITPHSVAAAWATGAIQREGPTVPQLEKLVCVDDNEQCRSEAGATPAVSEAEQARGAPAVERRGALRMHPDNGERGVTSDAMFLTERTFVLRTDALFCFETDACTIEHGRLLLDGAVVSSSSTASADAAQTLCLVAGGAEAADRRRAWHLTCPSVESRREWIAALRRAIAAAAVLHSAGRSRAAAREKGADAREMIAMVPTSEKERATPPLSEALLSRLIAMGIAVGCHYGSPQDIEWGYDVDADMLYVLQTRPVTAWSAAPGVGTWSLVCGTRVSCVLSEDMAVAGWVQFCAQVSARLTDAAKQKRVDSAWTSQVDTTSGGTFFWNKSTGESRWHRPDASALPELPVVAQARVAARGTHPDSLLRYARLFWGRSYCFDEMSDFSRSEALGLLPAAITETWWREWSAWEISTRMDLLAPLMPLVNIATQSSSGGVRDPAVWSDTKLSSTALHLTNAYVRAMQGTWTHGFLARHFEEVLNAELATVNATAIPHIDAGRLLTKLSHHHQTQRQPMAELHAIADEWGAKPGVATAIAAFGDGDDGAAALWRACTDAVTAAAAQDRETTPSSFDGVAAALVAFIARWHWMSDNDEDVLAAHWIDSPTLPVSVFASLVRGFAKDAAGPGRGLPPPRLARQDSGMVRHALEVERLRALVGHETDEPPHPVWNALRLVRRYLLTKENVHSCYAEIGAFLKVTVGELQRRLVARGVLEAESSDDGGSDTSGRLFDLRYETLTALLAPDVALPSDPACATAVALRGATSRGRVVTALYSNFEHPYWGGVEYRERATYASPSEMLGTLTAGGAQWSGLGCSAGRAGAAQGRARVVKTLAEAGRVESGDVLVTKTTAPAWTPLFERVSAVVMETGGMLSHGAVVAREFGVPCVSNVSNATCVFKDGELLIVDGRDGVVVRPCEEREEEEEDVGK